MNGKKILLVEDSVFMSQVICMTLDGAGFRTFVVRSGSECISSIRHIKPDLLVLDGVLPDMFGIDICKELRKNPRNNLLPIIMLTGQEDDELRLIALESGADDYIIKPFQGRELVSRATNIIRRVDRNRLANPLTGLRGSIEIDMELNQRISNGEKFGVVYADLDNLKLYNDTYGFYKGDHVILELADCLMDAAENYKDIFLGHIGGDDFVIITPSHVIEEFCRLVIANFDKKLPTLYSSADLLSRNSTADDQLISVSLSATTNEDTAFLNTRHIAEIMSDGIKQTKKVSGSSYTLI